ncbi:NO-inducible flavohemoprotein [Paenibacillus piri]|uniref:Flavohemoprotein n=1 Tax=Paenibacillus piri TaxID=2547395 RepID=A0A4R5KRB6_9BACL|nr:NO-inducible flavohemoprotein [Paenibacillus piri]TDF98291.1 NO-inducible flavohemoprotein [Paenibacillus piri]
MLNQATIQTIKSTVPVLEVHGTAITKRFYKLLFAAHPELLHLFNHANQKQGRQQTALANAVYAAAVHIDHLEAILPAVRQIGHKHRSLGVKPEHYPIVGSSLLAAIKDVLGDAATEEILAAWGEAYQVIADAFIGVEHELYEQAHNREGGWSGLRRFIVKRKEEESRVITSFYLVPEDGNPIASFEPGQYVSVHIQIPGNDYTHIRQYSLSDAPGKPYYRISVKREDAAEAKPAGIVSSYLHQYVQEGDLLSITAPAGGFTLKADGKPIVLLSGGVGLTPMISMLNQLIETGDERNVAFIHAALNGQTHAVKMHMNKSTEAHPRLRTYICYQMPTEADRAEHGYDKEGYVDLPWLKAIAPGPDASYYLCGPIPFMKSMYRMLKAWDVLNEDIHYEFFGPAGSLEAE